MLIFYALLLRLPSWWAPAGELNGRDAGAGVWGKAYLQLGIDNTTLNIIIPTLLLFFTALLANQIVTSHRMSEKPTQLPGLFIILVGSICPAMIGLHSIQPANFFLLIALSSTFQLYQRGQDTILAFNAGLWLGIAMLFNAYFLPFSLLLIIAIGSLNSLRLRLLLQLLIGIFLPLFLVGSWYFWSGKFAEFQLLQFPDFFGLQPGREAYWNLGGLAFIVTALTYVVFRQFANIKMLVIAGRKKVNLLYSWLLLTLFTLLLHSSFDFATAQLVIVPLGILISRSFARGRSATGEAAHFLMVVICLGLCIYPIII